MAEHLASLFGTEKDRVNVREEGREEGAAADAARPANAHRAPLAPPQCPFYFKIGACRHGDRCSRAHNRPTVSPTLLLRNLYSNPHAGAATATGGAGGALPPPPAADPRAEQAAFEDFYEDVFEELAAHGR